MSILGAVLVGGSDREVQGRVHRREVCKQCSCKILDFVHISKRMTALNNAAYNHVISQIKCVQVVNACKVIVFFPLAKSMLRC